MKTCPVCRAETDRSFPKSPYWMCGNCDCWFQSPMPPKTYEATHEKDEAGGFTGHLMSEADKQVNQNLASALFHNWLKGEKGLRTLDVGSKYPYLAHCLGELGCRAFGMDNIEIVPEYSKSLNVPMLMADFENISEEQIASWSSSESEKDDRFKLITMVHVFEHMYEPLEALRKLKKLLADDGILYIRLPDHSTSGFERDLTEGHYTIHPFFHSLSSILELLVQGQDLFTVTETYAINGSGQRDFILSPLMNKPILYAGLIAKNEQRDIPKCLKSIESIVDGIVVVDTGSTDKTIDTIHEQLLRVNPHVYIYTGASKKDEKGDWKLWDFSKARNKFVEYIEEAKADYLLWMDADDELITPNNLKRAIYWSQYKVFSVIIESGSQSWPQHRLWKTGLGIHYEGRCHEYPTVGGHPTLDLKDSIIRHDAAPGFGEDSNARNLRILEEEFKENPSPRCAFYLANTHKDAARYKEAIPFYASRIQMGSAFRDEWLFAHLYKGRCERAAGDFKAAHRTLLQGASEAPDWAEFWMELAYMAHAEGSQRKAIAHALLAARLSPNHEPIPPTVLWREPNKYTDQPLRIISWAYESMGETAEAIDWAYRAKDAIGCEDKEWDERIDRLISKSNELKKKLPESNNKFLKQSREEKIVSIFKNGVIKNKSQIAFHRPGAIGDILMTLNLIPIFKKENPHTEIHYFCHPEVSKGLEEVMIRAGVDRIEDSTRISSKTRESYNDRWIDLVGYPLHDGYPEKPMKKHLLHYFGEEMGISFQILPSLRLPLPKIYFASKEIKKYITLQAETGWSVYKNWSFERWEKVVEFINKEIKVPVFLIGKNKLIYNTNHDFVGADMKEIIALVANSSLHLGLDSFANHLTNYRWMSVPGEEGVLVSRRVPAIILWGSTQMAASGYPHNRNIGLGLPCQPCFREDPKLSTMPRGVCPNPFGQTYEFPRHACMDGISVERIIEEVRQAWGASSCTQNYLNIISQ